LCCLRCCALSRRNRALRTVSAVLKGLRGGLVNCQTVRRSLPGCVK
jgi:hypothetical protein